MMDVARIESLGLAPLKPDLDRIAAVTTRRQLEDLLASHVTGVGVEPIDIGLGFDRKQVNAMIVTISVGGLSLPAREFYLEPQFEPVRKLCLGHVARALQLAGFDQSDARAARVLALETSIAKVMWSNTELRDPVKHFNPTPAADLDRIAPGIDWKRFLA